MTSLRSHPLAMTTHFRKALVLTYAFPESLLASLVPHSLALETVGDLGFVAVALVDMQRLRPERLPVWTGSHAIFVGYRVFVRTELSDGRSRRGLKVLRTDVDRLHLLLGTRLMTRYDSGLVAASWTTDGPADRVRSRPRWQAAHLTVETSDDDPAAPPADSPFATWDDAAPFSGPLPWTLAPDPSGNSAIAVKGVRSGWDPRPVTVRRHEVGFFEREPFGGTAPVLASAFCIDDVDYAWRAGREESIHTPSGTPS